MAHVTELPRPTIAAKRTRIEVRQDTPDDLARRAWVGPAMGAAVLTIAWAVYLAPIFFGIMSTLD